MCTNQEEVEKQWCPDSNMLNVSKGKLKRIKNLIVKQKKFDTLPLGKAICWKCGKILYSTVDNSRTCLIPPPRNVTIEKAPGAAYLKALPYEHKLTFLHTSGKWYSCPVCKKGKAIPTDQHVGDVHLPAHSNRPRASENWNMELPGAIANLANDYEKRQVSLSGLYSTTLRDATPRQSRHVLGHVYTGHREDRHYYGLFGFLATKEVDIKNKVKKQKVMSELKGTQMDDKAQPPVQRILFQL